MQVIVIDRSENMKTFKTCKWAMPHLYSFKQITFKPGVTVLLGCNGAGKSTLQSEVKADLRSKGIPCFDYRAIAAKAEMNEQFFWGNVDVADFACSIIGSEGENMKSTFNHFMRDLGEFVRTFKGKCDSRHLYIFIDSLDSGWSIDNIDEFGEFLEGTLIPDIEGAGLIPHVIIAANSYEFARCFPKRCVDAMSGKHVRFACYEEYRGYILGCRARKDSRTEVLASRPVKRRGTSFDDLPSRGRRPRASGTCGASR